MLTEISKLTFDLFAHPKRLASNFGRTRTVARKSSIGGLCVCAGGLDIQN